MTDDFSATEGDGIEPVNNGTIWRIPKPFEPGIIFGTIPEHILDNFVKTNPNLGKDILAAFQTNTLASLMPNFAGPVIESQTNYSIFKDAPLIPSRLEGQIDSYQYTEYTTELAKELSKITAVASETLFDTHPKDAGMSPIVIENYVYQWTGGLGRLALKLLDKNLREAGVLENPPNKPEDTLSDIYFVQSFVVRHPSSNAEPLTKFYKNFRQIKSLIDTFDRVVATGDVEYEEIMGMDEFTFMSLDDMSTTLSEQSQLVRMITIDPTFTKEEKRQLIDQTYRTMIYIAETGNTIFESVKKK